MNAEKQRIKLAEFCGWVRVNTSPTNLQIWTHKYCLDCQSGKVHSHDIDELPDYLNDLNAIHEVEMLLNDTQYHHFTIWLHYVVFRVRLKRSPGLMRQNLSATAPQRAEALLRTINQWEDGE